MVGFLVPGGFPPAGWWIQPTVMMMVITPQISSKTNGLPLKVTLAWSDYPGQPFSNKALVEDLDLTGNR